MTALVSRRVHANEQDKARATLVSAFTNDPVERWLYPELQHYLTHFPRFIDALGGKAFQTETVWRLGEFDAVALWLPPGTEPDDDAITTALTDSVAPKQRRDVFAVLDQINSSAPTYPHWYLPWFGVNAELQGRGLGGVLMVDCLSILDATHLPAYLETTNPRNISFYERYGFEVTGEAQVGQYPPIAFMLRSSQ